MMKYVWIHGMGIIRVWKKGVLGKVKVCLVKKKNGKKDYVYLPIIVIMVLIDENNLFS